MSIAASPAYQGRTTEWKSILGFLKLEEALSYVKSTGIPTAENFERKLKEAGDYVASLINRKGQLPRSKQILAEGFENREQKLRGDASFAEHLQGMTTNAEFRMVEIGRLHAFQPHVNLEYTRRLGKDAPKVGDTEQVLRFCLPTKDEVKKQMVPVAFNGATNTFTMATENLDMRIIGQVQGEEPNSGRKFFGFVYGGGLPQISVVEYKGMVMLKNGYHRAYTLLEAGHEFMPCLYLKTDNYQFTGAVGPGFFNVDLMTSDRSPLLSDFMSKAALVYARPLTRMIISIHGEAQVVVV